MDEHAYAYWIGGRVHVHTSNECAPDTLPARTSASGGPWSWLRIARSPWRIRVSEGPPVQTPH
eukprot:2988260-Pyramimonas_sp.AAC.1